MEREVSDWWARKLGRAPAGPATPPAPQRPGNGLTGPAPVPLTAAGIQAQMWQDQQNHGAPEVMIEDASVPGGQRLNWRAWTGGRAHREETATCPQCGSTNYFSRRSESRVTQNGVAAPAPQCFNCSYNGMFQIFGGDG